MINKIKIIIEIIYEKDIPHKRIPDIIIDPKKQTKKKRITQNPKDNDIHKSMII